MYTGTRRPAGSLKIAVTAAAIFTFGALASSDARAGFSIAPGMSTLGGSANAGFESSGLTLGLGYTEPVGSMLQLGVFADITKMTSDSGNFGGLLFYGALVRINPGFMGLFIEGQIGPTQGTSAADSDMAIGYGAGAGFLFNVGSMKIGPRAGYRILSSETGIDPTPTRTSMDFSLQINFGGGSSGGGKGSRPSRRR